MHEPGSFGQWLKRLRADLDLTQEALAGSAGCAPETIRAYESGKRRPSRELAERLADVLQVPQEQRSDFVRQARVGGATKQPAAHPHDARLPAAEPGDSRVQAAGAGTASAGSPILATKLYMPRPRAALVSRSRLLARLDAGLARPLAIVAAPAGFGKTTILTEWLNSRQPDEAPQATRMSHHVAWLALDAGDSDPHVFLRYLIAAFQTIVPTIATTALTLLRAVQPPSVEMLLPLLLNDLVLLPDRSILVLDDYHVIDAPAIHQALMFLVEHLPPQLHLVIASRADPPLPLARMRARGQLTELRAQDLRFTLDETALFLREVMGLPLSLEDVAALETRTEGWIAGLQLAALSLQDRVGDQRAAFIDAFTGSHRFVVDYLVDEVLTRQPAHIQTFLLQTSILEQLSGPLCDVIVLGEELEMHDLGRQPGNAYSQLLLEDLERGNLFIIPLDDERRWYRYHHLFAQVLRERLRGGASPDVLATLHQRAAAWFDRQGMVAEAVRHALAAGDIEHAATLIEQHGRLLMMRGQVHMVLGWLNTLLKVLPSARPSLWQIHALGLFCVNQPDAAEHHLQQVEDALSQETDERSRTILGHAMGLRAAIARFRGDLSRWHTLMNRTLEILPPAETVGRNVIRVNLATSFLLNGDVSEASERVLRTAVTRHDAGDLTTRLYGIVCLAELQRRQGRLRQAAVTYQEALALLPEPLALRTLLNGAIYYFGLGDLLRERNDVDAAEQHLTQGREMVLGTLATQAWSVFQGYWALARLAWTRGAHESARTMLQEFETLAHDRGFAKEVLERVAAARARIALWDGDLIAATRWADTSAPQSGDLHYSHEMEYLTLARVRITQWRADPTVPSLTDVTTLLARLLEATEHDGRVESQIEILILQAIVSHREEPDRARAALERALRLAAPEGFVRVFVDEGAPIAALLAEALDDPGWMSQTQPSGVKRAYAQNLLDILRSEGLAPRDPPLPVADLHAEVTIEQLTEREREVLVLLARGSSNQAIADTLVLAVGTVKRHVNSILSKLGVASRLQAVARARELGIL